VILLILSDFCAKYTVTASPRGFVLPTSLASGLGDLQTRSYVGQAVLVVVFVLGSGHAE
jgi:hypothetical protein